MKRADPLAHFADELSALEERGLRRFPGAAVAATVPTFCSNDYLGYGSEAAADGAASAGASRLVAGERAEHGQTEAAFAEWLGVERALLFTSGYAANVGALSALAQAGDLLVSDALNHASMIDGARLARARVVVTPHNDLTAIKAALASRSEARAWVAVESYTSMDADGPDLLALRTLCDEYGSGLYVDEAHALGVLGPGGRGRLAEAGVKADVLVGTLGKSFGSQGAFVAGTRVLREWLWNRARSFVFSTGLAPTCAAAAHRSLARLVANPEISGRVAGLATRLRAGLAERNIVASGFGHIVPLVVGPPGRAVALAAALAERGVIVQAIRPPTVAVGTSRLRLTVTALHDEEEIDRAVLAIASVMSDG